MDHATTMRSAYQRINEGNLAGFADLMSDDFVEHEQTPGIPPTKGGVIEYFTLIRAAFPDLRMDVEDLICSGDKAVARVRASGTQRGPFMGIPATNRAVEMNLIDIMQFNSAGLVCAHWGVADMLTMMQQLGVVPAGPPA